MSDMQTQSNFNIIRKQNNIDIIHEKIKLSNKFKIKNFNKNKNKNYVLH